MSARIWLLAAVLAACNADDPGTSVRVTLRYPDELGLDTADVTLSDRGASGKIAHELLLLVPDELAGETMPITVWGLKDGRRSAYGETMVTAARDQTVPAELTLTACTPACDGNVLMSCVGAPVSCPLGCSTDGDAHCIGPVPSNGVDPALAGPVRGVTRITGTAMFNTDTGEITGDLVRAAGTGLVRGIGFYTRMQGATPLGVFVFHELDVDAGATVRFTGARAVVFLVGDRATIAGDIDADAGHGRQDVPGPGGGAGSTERNLAGGCAPGVAGGGGGDGMRPVQQVWDSGGGGGGHVEAGGMGGPGNGGTVEPGGGGTPCADVDFLQPLIGGGGGGKGGPGVSATAASGGGGGGALQITALTHLTVTGVIHASGAGGEGGTLSASDGGGGGGGGAGGSILLEAPILTIAGATLAAKGGGGGGDGGAQPTPHGENGGTSTATPEGSAANDAGGGAGGALGPPDLGNAGTYDGAGGGGARGRIVLRSEMAELTGIFVPRPDQAPVRR